MSSALYRLGAAAYRRHRLVIATWIFVLVLAGALAGLLSQGTTNAFTIPGTPGQTALEQLEVRFPQVAGGQAQMVVLAPAGSTVEGLRTPIEAAVQQLQKVDGVAAVVDPFADNVSGALSRDGRAALVTVQLGQSWETVTDDQRAAIEATSTALRDRGATVEFGGQVFSSTGPGLSATESLGVVVALVVLLVTFGSLRAAGLPLLTALAGVGVTMALVMAASAWTTISSTVPLLALMIGLAVGIDYALFILSRHRDQLAEGLDPQESAARAVATAGSAVVFAGLTVMIALAGLAVAHIPFLTTMGLAAAGAVLVAVLVALTLLPAIFGVSRERLRPKAGQPRKARKERTRFALRYIRLITRRPLLVVVVVVAGLAVMAIPAKDLRLALPDNGVAPADTTQRKAFDLIAQHYGPGYNAPMILTADIITTTDPIGVVEGLAADVRKLPSVAGIQLATPNPSADTGIVVVIPRESASSPATSQLVADLRAHEAQWREKYGVDTAVTGQAALAIDVSDRLGHALLPFALLVVGMSVLLLGAVFRSVVVPIKATIGYLLSVGASFGAVAAVFDWGWLAGPLDVTRTGPVISFMPIILMGVLFGLAMDYEVFLVSRMREEYVHTGDPQRAVTVGYTAGARVVTAAALIMISVFAAFVPHGDANIKPIAFALAIGVLIDAFVVRMTLVPAVLALLGRAAWWLPGGIDRRLPRLDVEGENLREQQELAGWPGTGDVIHAEDVELGDRLLTVSVPAGGVLVLRGTGSASALALQLAARVPWESGRARVAGLLLPGQAAAVRRRVGLAELPGINDLDDERTVEQHVAERISAQSALLRVPRARIARVLGQVDDAVLAATGQAERLDPRTRVGDLGPLERRILGLVLGLIGHPAVVVAGDVDALRGDADRAALWRCLTWITGTGVTVVAVASEQAPAADLVPPERLVDLDLTPSVVVH